MSPCIGFQRYLTFHLIIVTRVQTLPHGCCHRHIWIHTNILIIHWVTSHTKILFKFLGSPYRFHMDRDWFYLLLFVLSVWGLILISLLLAPLIIILFAYLRFSSYVCGLVRNFIKQYVITGIQYFENYYSAGYMSRFH